MNEAFLDRIQNGYQGEQRQCPEEEVCSRIFGQGNQSIVVQLDHESVERKRSYLERTAVIDHWVIRSVAPEYRNILGMLRLHLLQDQLFRSLF